MRSLTWLGLVSALGALIAGTVMVFYAFDRDSHSLSDTLRLRASCASGRFQALLGLVHRLIG
jgi:hypothetical protein